MASRLVDVRRFYELLALLEEKLGGTRLLEEADGKMDWPRRGVYFFFEHGEDRSTSGNGLRVVRIGTHALRVGAKSTLWKRLRQHWGTMSGAYAGGGNHRGSIFRGHVGYALMRRDEWSAEVTSEWSQGSTADRELRMREFRLEQRVSAHIRMMPFLWLLVDDSPRPESSRGLIERNAIALLSNYPEAGNAAERVRSIDPPSLNWLGINAASEKVSRSGLWNSNHVDAGYQRDFLSRFESYIMAI